MHQYKNSAYKASVEDLKASLGAFNVSKNCDHSSPENFYNSYIARKKFIINNKLSALQKGKVVNSKKMTWHVSILELVMSQPTLTMEIIKSLLSEPPVTSGGHLERRARRLLEEVQNEN